jgi:phage terminase large subunit-like protein
MNNPAANPTFFGLIYAAKPDDDFDDPKVWRKANPSMGITFPEDEFRADWEDSLTNPVKRSRWLRYSLNVWTTPDNRWFTPEAYAPCVAPPPLPLEGRSCFIGLDLADHLDLTAAVALFPDGQGGYDAEAMFWMPEENVTEREKEAKEIRAEGAEAAQRIRADAEKQRTILLAEAERDAQKLRGEGDSKAIRLYADAFNRDPAFFEFLRTLQAYENSLIDPEMLLILDPSMQFLRPLQRGE